MSDDNSNILLSIIVPCYNCEKTLDSSVKSLLMQKDTDEFHYQYEIVLVDDGSNDSTASICDKYACSEKKIRVVHKPNGGLVDAWKTGVSLARGEYIAFCDSDDYLDDDFVSKVSTIVRDFRPDIIAYGMVTEYDNGDSVRQEILLEEGYYSRTQIEKDLFPKLLSNGDMQTELLGSSRCNKVFKTVLLQKCMVDVPNEISFGEDDVICFSAELNAQDIYSLCNYFPYHYVRNIQSMIGGYDEMVFEKISFLQDVYNEIAIKYNYSYSNQVQRNILSIYFLYIKKEICRNPYGYNKIKDKLKEVRYSKGFVDSFDYNTIREYTRVKRVFAELFVRGFYFTLFLCVRAFEAIRGRNV